MVSSSQHKDTSTFKRVTCISYVAVGELSVTGSRETPQVRHKVKTGGADRPGVNTPAAERGGQTEVGGGKHQHSTTSRHTVMQSMSACLTF